MTFSSRHTYGWLFGRWLVTIQIERVECASTCTPTNGEHVIDWDALAEQYDIPASADGDGLQLCAQCGQSVALNSRKFTCRMALENFTVRIAQGYPYPVGAYLCLTCADDLRTRGNHPNSDEHR